MSAPLCLPYALTEGQLSRTQRSRYKVNTPKLSKFDHLPPAPVNFTQSRKANPRVDPVPFVPLRGFAASRLHESLRSQPPKFLRTPGRSQSCSGLRIQESCSSCKSCQHPSRPFILSPLRGFLSSSRTHPPKSPACFRLAPRRRLRPWRMQIRPGTVGARRNWFRLWDCSRASCS